MLLSSRPEPEFIEAFRHTPSLRLEDLTSGDITTYVTKCLESHSRMKLLRKRNNDAANNLIAAVVTRASGVFLWVVLVVRSLLEGLSDGSYLEELEKTVEACPKELRELYEHMFGRMKPAHRIQAAKLFQSISCCLEYERRLPSAFRLSFIDRDDPFSVIQAPIQKLSISDFQGRVQNICDRLRSRCCGLIEVHGDSKESKTPDATFIKSDFRNNEGRLAFLHRSVSEFLREPNICKQIEAQTQDTTFNVFESNLSSLLFCLKSRQFFHIRDYKDWKKYVTNLKFFWDYCRLSKGIIGVEHQIAYIEDMDDTLKALWNDSEHFYVGPSENSDLDSISRWGRSVLDILKLSLKSPQNRSLKSYKDRYPMLALAFRFGLSAYVDYHLSSLKFPVIENCHPVSHSLIVRGICWLMSSDCFDLRKEQLRSIECILEYESKLHAALSSTHCLLEDKADPMQNGNIQDPQFWKQAPWQILLCLRPLNVSRSSFPTLGMASSEGILENRTEVEILEDWAHIVMLFINHGTRLDRLCGNQTARDRIRDQVKYLSTPTKYFSAEDRARIERVQDMLTKVVESKPRLNNILVQDQQPQINIMHNQRQADEISVAAGSRTSTTKEVEENLANLIRGYRNKPCTRCKAIKTVTEMGYSADSVIWALDNAGVGTDNQGLISWLMDHESKNEASHKLDCSNGTASTSITESHKQTGRNTRINAASPTHVHTLTTTAVHQQWSTVAARPNAPPKEVVGAQWLTPPKQKAKKRSKGAITEKSSDIALEPSSSGIIEIGSGSITWIMDSKNGVGKTPTLSSVQVNALTDFLNGLVLDGQA